MKKLSEMKQGEKGIVSSVNGDARYVGRITSIALLPDACPKRVLRIWASCGRSCKWR